MKKIFEKISAAFEKIPVVAYILSSFLKWFFAAGVFAIVFFVILWTTGLYARLEVMLDLKYNSLIIVAPMLAFAGLSLVCLLVGFLLYIHKYRRRISKNTDFYKAIVSAFGEK